MKLEDLKSGNWFEFEGVAYVRANNVQQAGRVWLAVSLRDGGVAFTGSDRETEVIPLEKPAFVPRRRA